jgi:hypothetical protein
MLLHTLKLVNCVTFFIVEVDLNTLSSAVAIIRLILNGVIPISVSSALLQVYGCGSDSLDDLSKVVVEGILRDICNTDEKYPDKQQLKKNNAKLMDSLMNTLLQSLFKVSLTPSFNDIIAHCLLG